MLFNQTKEIENKNRNESFETQSTFNSNLNNHSNINSLKINNLNNNRKIKLIKSYYNKDASESVSRSFLNFEKKYKQNLTNKISESSSSFHTNNISDSSISISSKLNFKNDSSCSSSRKNSINKDNIYINDTDTASCTWFVNQLVNDKLNKNHFNNINQDIESKTLPLNKNKSKSIIKRFSIKSLKNQSNQSEILETENIFTNNLESEQRNSKDIIQIGVKLISKILIATNNNSTSTLVNNNHSSPSLSKSSQSSVSNINISQTNSTFKTNFVIKSFDDIDSVKMYYNQTSQKQVTLLSKKLRKYLPFNYGLKNHGNTCFMNCVLQCLFQTPPLAFFFVSNQFEEHINLIEEQRAYQSINRSSSNNSVSSYVLTQHFYRLLNSLWRNTYDSNYSADLKNLIGYLNPTFAGVNQNDSHEFCVWLLNRLSEELSYKLANSQPRQIESDHSSQDDDESNEAESKNHAKQVTKSFIEDLFKVEFKSTVTCSKCNYKSSKLETDMMLSLPLPQNDSNSKKSDINFSRYSMYLNLILNNKSSIKNFKSKFEDEYSSISKTPFYINEINQERTFPYSYTARLGFNLYFSKDKTNYTREFMSLNNGNSKATVINPELTDLRKYIEVAHKIDTSNIVFINLDEVQTIYDDSNSIKEYFSIYSKNSDEMKLQSSLCAIELNNDSLHKDQIPTINIIAINFYNSSSGYMHYSDNFHSPKKLKSVGLPFNLIINRDCTYKELCKKLLESQVGFLKDLTINKYKDLAEKFFSLYLVTSFSRQPIQLSSTVELPLYAEYIEKALNDSIHFKRIANNGDNLVIEHIRLIIEWRSYEDLTIFFKDLDIVKVDLIHQTVKQLERLDEEDELSKKNNSYDSYQSSTKELNQNLIKLDDCFELFTQCEELSDENSWTCTRCKRQTNAYKQLSISNVPPILIIHLKRFFYKSRTSNFKLTTPVWFPVSNLDMSKYLSNNKNKELTGANFDHSCNSDYVYDLYAVCNHKGSNMANGHYTAFCKNMVDTKWYCFDDSNCIPLNEQNGSSSIFNNGSTNICTENAYILFYKKRNCMRNERWWLKYIDRPLLDYDEFDFFFKNLDYIEDQQIAYQVEEEDKFLRKKLFNNKNQDKYNDLSYNIYSNINYYDENKKPSRLIRLEQSRESLSNISQALSSNKQNSDISISSRSSSSKVLSNITTSNTTISSPSSKSSSYSKSQTDKNLIDLENDLNKNLKEEVDYLLNYPNDNEYIFKNQSDFTVPINNNENIYARSAYNIHPQSYLNNNTTARNFYTIQHSNYMHNKPHYNTLYGPSFATQILFNNFERKKNGQLSKNASGEGAANINLNNNDQKNSNNGNKNNNPASRYVNPSSIETSI